MFHGFPPGVGLLAATVVAASFTSPLVVTLLGTVRLDGNDVFYVLLCIFAPLAYSVHCGREME